MLNLDMGVQGAKRSRYHPSSPDALLRKIVEKNSSATESELEEIFEEQAKKYEASVIPAIIAYWFANRYRALVRELTPVEETRKKKAAREAKAAREVKMLKKAAVGKIGRVLLDKVAPACGKQLRDMTKQDCRREGGWYMALAGKLKRGQTVKQASITDEELWGIYSDTRL